jgi:hypothetical protein
MTIGELGYFISFFAVVLRLLDMWHPLRSDMSCTKKYSFRLIDLLDGDGLALLDCRQCLISPGEPTYNIGYGGP